MSLFITNPPAASTTAAALIVPVSAKCRQRTPTTPSAEPPTTKLVAPVSYRICTPSSAARLSSRSITIFAPWVSPGTGTLCPRGAGLAMSLNGQTFSLPVYINPWVPGWITAFSG